MRVGELDEMEVTALRGRRAVREQPGGEGDSGQPGKLQEIAAIGVLHVNPSSVFTRHYRALGADIPPGIKSTVRRY
jgi:hypothetical protein